MRKETRTQSKANIRMSFLYFSLQCLLPRPEKQNKAQNCPVAKSRKSLREDLYFWSKHQRRKSPGSESRKIHCLCFLFFFLFSILVPGKPMAGGRPGQQQVARHLNSEGKEPCSLMKQSVTPRMWRASQFFFLSLYSPAALTQEQTQEVHGQVGKPKFQLSRQKRTVWASAS